MPRLIAADALVEWLKRAGNFLKIETDHKRITHIIGKIIDHIEAMPTIDPESLRPKGEWIMRGGKLYCSHCGKRAGVARDREDFWYTVGTDFCPNCGADMRQKEAGNV